MPHCDWVVKTGLSGKEHLRVFWRRSLESSAVRLGLCSTAGVDRGGVCILILGNRRVNRLMVIVQCCWE